MPFASKAQNRFIRWVEENPQQARKEGIKPGFAKKFIADTAGQKVPDLPERAPKPEKRAHGGRAFTMPPRPTGW